MYMSKEKFGQITRKYDLTICGNADVEDALLWVLELLRAEIDALKETAPWAFVEISDFEKAYETIRSLDAEGYVEAFDEFCRGYNDLPYDYKHQKEEK